MRERLDTFFSAAKRLVVASPHLDDAVLSIGAALSAARRRGTNVVVLTIFAGDPESRAEPGWWDQAVGFPSAGAAAAQRRAEDESACALIGASPVWLPFADAQYEEDRTPIADAVEPIVRSADAVLVPGFPLDHPDHAWVHRFLVARRDSLPPLALYAEEPYAEAAWVRDRRLPQSGVTPELDSIWWTRARPRPIDWWRKQRAVYAYRSQLRAMARPAVRVPLRVAYYEARFGGEGFGLLTAAESASASSAPPGEPRPSA